MSRPDSSIRDWIKASRLRTLPLAFSSIITGTALVIIDPSAELSWSVTLLTLFTTLCLQVLSNWANDYGDFVKGTDNETRIGPARSLQSGRISAESMKKGIIALALISFVSGLYLLYLSGILMKLSGMILVCLGLLSIWAAIRYTAGDRAYGYAGLGDISVFIFFGLLGVLGSAFLHTHSFSSSLMVLPAAAIGFLSTAVLNLNNMRDAQDDRSKGKMTMAVRLGERTAKAYHFSLITFALLCLIIFSYFKYTSALDFIWIIMAPVLILHLNRVIKNQEAAKLDPELKKVALSTFAISLLLLASALL